MKKKLQPAQLDERLLTKLQDLEREIRQEKNDPNIILLAFEQDN